MMSGPRHNEGGRLQPLPDLVRDPHDHSFIVKMMIEMLFGGNLRINLKTHRGENSQILRITVGQHDDETLNCKQITFFTGN